MQGWSAPGTRNSKNHGLWRDQGHRVAVSAASFQQRSGWDQVGQAVVAGLGVMLNAAKSLWLAAHTGDLMQVSHPQVSTPTLFSVVRVGITAAKTRRWNCCVRGELSQLINTSDLYFLGFIFVPFSPHIESFLGERMQSVTMNSGRMIPLVLFLRNQLFDWN